MMHSMEHKYTDFGYELLRNELLPELLGKDEPAILYWGGKALSRRHPLENVEELIRFFQEAGWGTLNVIKEKKSEISLELPLTEETKKAQYSRQLEAGFLAGQLESITGCPAETYVTSKSYRLLFHIQWDVKDRA